MDGAGSGRGRRAARSAGRDSCAPPSGGRRRTRGAPGAGTRARAGPRGVQEDQHDGRPVQVAARLGRAERGVPALGADERQLVRVACEDQRQRGDEHRPGGGAAHGTEAAEHHHREVVHGQHQPEVVRHDPAERERQQHPGEPGVHGRHDERGGPVPRDGDPITAAAVSLSRSAASARPGRDRRTPRAVTQVNASSARPRYHSRLGPEGNAQDHQGRAVRREGEPADRHRWHGTAVEAARHRVRGQQHVVADEDQRQRRHTEVHALDAAGDRAEQPAREPRQQHRQHHRHERRQTCPGSPASHTYPYAPTARKKACPSDNCPAVPVSRVSPTAPIAAAMANTPVRSQYASA